MLSGRARAFVAIVAYSAQNTPKRPKHRVLPKHRLFQNAQNTALTDFCQNSAITAITAITQNTTLTTNTALTAFFPRPDCSVPAFRAQRVLVALSACCPLKCAARASSASLASISALWPINAISSTRRLVARFAS